MGAGRPLVSRMYKQPHGIRNVYDLIDTTDPAFRAIACVLMALRQLEMDLSNPEVVKEAVKASRRLDEENISPAGLAFAHALAHADRKKEPVPPPGNHAPVVYYARMATFCKIGTTVNMKARMQSIGAEEVLITEPGGHNIERMRHRQFKELRNHGEWFRYEGRLVEWVKKLQAEAA